MKASSDRAIVLYAFIATLCVLVNITAFIFQFIYHELPCPLCLLQRFGFMGIGLGATLSIVYNPSWKYNLVILFSSIFTLIVAIRQVLLHILPHDIGYGSTFLKLHFYTWSTLISFGFITSMCAVHILKPILGKLKIPQFALKFCCNLAPPIIQNSLIVIAFVNMAATYLECGLGMCPSDPTSYLEGENLFKLLDLKDLLD